MLPRIILLTATLLCVVILVACVPATPANMPNPASVFCEENGGKLDILKDATGAESGMCVFADGSECDEWAYFRGECQPGASLKATSAPETTRVVLAEFAADGCRIYTDTELDYSFHYPADAIIQSNDNPLSGISVVGQLRNNEHLYIIAIQHTGDMEDWGLYNHFLQSFLFGS